ncbi:MAG: hypothetical protein IPP17_16090 [Bacteroidetes bacterium]|nr:hypothetical protein [Bacteroidota bacterium]
MTGNKILQPLLAEWTSDAALVAIHGKMEPFSEQLANVILKNFFKGQTVDAFKLLPEYGDWPWCGHQISKAFVFETRKGIWVMSFGMSS